jgi:hypothetical protein
VTSRIKQARRVVGDDGKSQRVIRTVHARGYRFVADTVVRDDRIPAPPPAVTRPPVPVRYAETDGLHIAHQVTGQGDRDIVLVPGFVSHLELDWDDPRHARFLDRLASFGRLIRFDKRGTGMSDRPEGLPDVETRLHDVLAASSTTKSCPAAAWGHKPPRLTRPQERAVAESNQKTSPSVLVQSQTGALVPTFLPFKPYRRLAQVTRG